MYMRLLKNLSFYAFVMASTSYSVSAQSLPCYGATGSLEEAREITAHLLRGEYSDFFDRMDEFPVSRMFDRQESEAELSLSFPDGFDECTTLLVEEYSEWMRVEIVAFGSPDEVELYLLLYLVRLSDGWIVENYFVTTDFRSAIGNLR